jgi:hypothetical protein
MVRGCVTPNGSIMMLLGKEQTMSKKNGTKPTEMLSETVWKDGVMMVGIVGTVLFAGWVSYVAPSRGPELEIIADLHASPTSSTAITDETGGKSRSGDDGDAGPDIPVSDTETKRLVQTLKVNVIRLPDLQPVEGAKVWAVVTDAKGNRQTRLPESMEGCGDYCFDNIHAFVEGIPLKKVTVHARDPAPQSSRPWSDVPWIGRRSGAEAKQELALPGFTGARYRTVHLSAMRLVALPTIFFFSLLIPFMMRPTKLRHCLSLSLAVAFTLVMIAHFSLALFYVHSVVEADEVLALGFASIFQGRYAEGLPADWLASLTLTDGNLDAVGHGFGAPLWVMLLSVVGAGLLTVSLVVNEISDRPDNRQELRERDQYIVQHQFFIFFAPIGAIFVYQLLVAAGAVAQPLTVAVAALGAGASLNYLLVLALEKVQDLFKSRKERMESLEEAHAT